NLGVEAEHQAVVAAPVPERLHRHRGGEQVHALPAVGGRDRQAQDPELRALGPALAREGAGVVARLEVGVELVARELAHRALELLLLRAQAEVHDASGAAPAPPLREPASRAGSASIEPSVRSTTSRWRSISR